MSNMRVVCLACLMAGLLLVGPAAATAAPPDLERATVAELQSQMAAGQLTSVQLTRAYIDRIAAVNARGPGLNAVRTLNPRALTDASLLDLERATGRLRGPLHGVPVLVKDNLDVAGLPTTAGSVALQNSVPDRDSTVVAKLRAAGAVIVGKTNLTEFANFMTNGMANGYSSLGGQVLNPYDLDAGTSGSSSGSGAAAAAGLAAVTIGTETSGSIVSPAAQQGIVGLRPTVGLVSRAGILPISATQDTAGPMTRTVADAAAELQAIAGKDPGGPGHGLRAGHGPELRRGAEHHRAGRQAHRHRLQSDDPADDDDGAVPRRGRGHPGARRDHGHDSRARRARRRRHPHAGVQARPQRLPGAAPAERADEVAAGHHHLQHRARRRGAEVRPDAAHRQPGHGPQRPRAERRVHHRP